MRFRDYLGMALGDLSKRKFRTFLTSFAVAIGTMLIVVMVGLGIGTKEYIINILKENMNVKSVQVLPIKNIDAEKANAKISSSEEAREEAEEQFKKIDNQTIKTISQIKGVTGLQSVLTTNATSSVIDGKKSKSVSISGYDLNYDIFLEQQIETVQAKEKNKKLQPIIAGRNLKKGEQEGVLVGQKFLKALGITKYEEVIGKEIILKASLPGAVEGSKPLEVKKQIVGVIDEHFQETAEIITSIELVADIQGYYTFTERYYEQSGPSSLSLSIQEVGDVKEVSNKIKEMGYMVVSYETIAEQIKSIFYVVEVILAIGGTIVLLVASLGVINTMTMSIYERTRSIGIMKAVGASRRTIKNLFIAESGAIGFLGGIGGILLGYLNIEVIGVIIGEYFKKQGIEKVEIFSLPYTLILGVLAFSIGISIIAGLYPSHKAAKLDPIEALRYE